jgi:two-component system, NtrC family, nitrogen regulation response regulator GlnG
MDETTPKTILVADDDAAIRTVVTQALSRAGYDVRATGTASSLWHWVSNGDGDLVITDVVLPDEDAFQVLPRMKKIRPRLPIVVMSAKNTIVTAITAAELGAFDYLPKPFDLNELISIAGRALQDTKRQQPSVKESGEQSENLPLIGRSGAMQDIYRVIARLTQSDLTVLITGESGSGKELVARVLHDFGRRRKGPFVAVNMAAIPRELIESELFGHEKGAFTGAINRQRSAICRWRRRHGCCGFCSRASSCRSEGGAPSKRTCASSPLRIATCGFSFSKDSFARIYSSG